MKFCSVSRESKPFGVRAHHGGLLGMKFDPKGRILATCGADLACRIWVEVDGYWGCHHEFELDGEITSMSWSPFVGDTDHPLLLSLGFSSGNISVWLFSDYDRNSREVSPSRRVSNINDEKHSLDTEPKLITTLKCHPFHPVTSMAIHPKGNVVAVGSTKANSVNFWSLQYGVLLSTVTGFGGVNDLCWVGANALTAGFNRSEVS
jgi:WD40 repeat protein